MKILATFIFLLASTALFSAQESKSAKTIDDKAVPIEMLTSIDQITYERSNADNIVDGYLMCGLFAAYNGEIMINRLHGLRGRVNTRLMTKPDQFNNWMMINGSIISALQRRGVGNIPGNIIEQLLPQTDFYRENCTVIELATLHDSFLTIEDKQTFLPTDNKILEVIRVFRSTKLPHLVILNTGSHWISVVITPDSCFVADSLNIDRKADPTVRMLYHLFTKELILPQAQIDTLRAVYRDHSTDKAVDGSLELESAMPIKEKKGKGKGKSKAARTKRRATTEPAVGCLGKKRGSDSARKLQRITEGTKKYPPNPYAKCNGKKVSDQKIAYDKLKKIAVNIKHLAIVPDGDRRWAKEKGLDPSAGHKRAIIIIPILLIESWELGIHTVTLSLFSTETWGRGNNAVKKLMEIFENLIMNILPLAPRYKVKMVHLGRRDRLPKHLLIAIKTVEEKTKIFEHHIFNFAIDHGGRDEIVRACNKLLSSRHKKKQAVTEEALSGLMDTAKQKYPNPDLLIRTGKVYRTSGFLSWQSAYSELYFPQIYFPDFDKSELYKAILSFGERRRTFGR